MAPRGSLAAPLREQADACEVMGSPLYAYLLRRAAEDVEARGACGELLAPHAGPGRAGALALRFMAAVHRLVLSGRLPELARHYPTAGGRADDLPSAWREFRAAVDARPQELADLVRLPCQTNEVGRCAALVFGFLEIAQTFRLPLRLLEVGASAGLSLRWDRFHYSGAGAAWGDAGSPVQLVGLWSDAPRFLDAPVQVVARSGCDRRPLSPARAEDRLGLESSVWADQPTRLERLRGACEVARDLPASLDEARLDEWLPPQLADVRPGTTTVVYHSVVEEYLTPAVRERFRTSLADAGGRASQGAPLAWLRLEPTSELRHHALTLTLWPEGTTRRLAVCGAHGSHVRRAELV